MAARSATWSSGDMGTETHPDALEGGVAVEQGAVFGVGVEEVEGMDGSGAASGPIA